MSLRAWRSMGIIVMATCAVCTGGALLLCFLPRIVEWR